MANDYILWNIKERRVEGIYPQSADATSAQRRVIGKSGTKTSAQTGKANIDSTHLEVLTCTRP